MASRSRKADGKAADWSLRRVTAYGSTGEETSSSLDQNVSRFINKKR